MQIQLVNHVFAGIVHGNRHDSLPESLDLAFNPLESVLGNTHSQTADISGSGGMFIDGSFCQVHGGLMEFRHR